mgnify:FL=1
MEKFIKDFKLILCEDYISCTCYKSEEKLNTTPLISGLYLNKKKSFGYLPKEINMTIEFYSDKKTNKEFTNNFKNDIFFSVKGDQIIENGILHFKTIIRHIKHMGISYRQYFGSSFDVKDIYIHEDFLLRDSYPENMFIKLNWEYKEIKPKKTDQLTIFDDYE